MNSKPSLANAFFCSLALAAAALLGATPASAQLKVEVTSGVTDPIPIAVVPFARSAGDGGSDVSAIVSADLAGSGRFKLLPRAQMPATPTSVSELVPADWRTRGNDYVVIGRTSSTPDGQIAIDYDIVNVLTGQRVANGRYAATAASLRNAAHRVSDAVFEKILGIKGAFATRIAYVSVDGRPPTQRFQLIVADADGENSRTILESQRPLMSPAWSSDGEWLAYVSFENRLSAVYVQRVRTGERTKVSARAGVNGAPAFSPDGKRLALTLGGSGGNLDIYVLDLGSQALTRITDDPSIDTEPYWAPDGNSIYFNSDRAGSPQIYRVGIGAGERPRRITFGGSYNARPRVSADGTQLAMVTLEGNAYRIAVQDLSNGNVRVLSKGSLDESPSFAPNGVTLIYTTRTAGQSGLATVSNDGLVGQRLKADQGEVREPVWGPFLK